MGNRDTAEPKGRDPGNAAVPPHSRIVTWSGKPAARWAAVGLVCVILALPAWMLRDHLRDFILLVDDFDYLGDARDWPTTWAHLFEPHNLHVVPIFRLWTYAAMTLAGRLQGLPTVLAVASYLSLVAAMVSLGYLVVRDTRQPVAALGAMAALGISTVSNITVIWYSATQTLWAGAACVVTVALARGWGTKGGAVRLAAVALGAAAAPAIWSGGLAAGPAAIAYLLVSKTPRRRWPALLLLAGITMAGALLITASPRRHLRITANFWEQHPDLWPRPVQAVLHTAQALVEACFFANLGVDATTTPWQAIALLVALAAVHSWSRGGPGRISPLEAAGATIAVACCLMEYTSRGDTPYSNLRPAVWYHAIPQVGAVLFLAGWWAALRADGFGRFTRGQVTGVLSFVVVFSAIHAPRAQLQIITLAPPFAPNEAAAFPTSELRLTRALYYKDEVHRRQVRALARLDRVDRILARAGASPELLRDVFGRVLIPGIAEKQYGIDAFTLLVRRPGNDSLRDALSPARSEIMDLLQPEPEPVPFWLDPDDPLARAVRDVSKQPAEKPRSR